MTPTFFVARSDVLEPSGVAGRDLSAGVASAPRPAPGARVARRGGHSVTHRGDESVIEVWGEWDGSKAWFLREFIAQLVAQGQRRIVLDVGEMSFVEFTGVGVLIGALTRARRSGAEVAVQPRESGAYEILRRAGLTAALNGDPIRPR